MTFNELESVVLLKDVPDAGLRAGDLGAVVHVYEPNSLEVEFVRTQGRTQALLTLAATDVRGIRGTDMTCVRPTDGPALP